MPVEGRDAPTDRQSDDYAALRRRVAELDQSLEQALVAAEDTQEQNRLLIEDRARLEAELEDRRHEAIELHRRIAVAETSRDELYNALMRTDTRLRTMQRGEDHLAEELRTSYEELQAMTEELERANEDLEQRVEERTAQLRESETRYRTLFEAMDEGFLLAEVIFDPDGRPVDIHYHEANPAAARLTGKNFVGRRLSQIDPGFEPYWCEIFGRTARTGEPARMERYAAPLGIWFNFFVFKVGQPEDARVAVVFQDVTKRRAAETELKRAKEAAEAASRAKTKFLAAASHDLRQPIQAASLYAHVLHASLGGNRKAEEALDLLKASIESLNGMLSGLLDLSRLEAGAVEVAVRDVLPDELMRRLAAEFQGPAKNAGAELRCLPCTVPVSTDPHLLERVLRNLISNAITHGDAHGRGRILFGCRRRGDGIEFQVWDNGPGIPEEARETIFEEFRQLKNPERNSAQGFGLGLSIVARIARLLGTRVTVRSTVGRGSMFAIAVPHARRPAVTAPAAPAVDPALAVWLKGRTIILVEDDDRVRRGLTMTLQRWGARVFAASSTEELAALLPRLRRRPHALLTDYRLPGGSTGRSVVELVRRRWDVPGLIITGDTAPERLREARSLGCRLLHKPVEPDELVRALGEVMKM